MAGSPRWKVSTPSGIYVASAKELVAAFVLASFYGSGSTIRDGEARNRPVVWTEGADGESQASYDDAAKKVVERVVIPRRSRV